MAPKTKHSSIEESRINLRKFEIRYDLFKTACKFFFYFLIARYAYKAIQVLAGKFTLADIRFSAILNQEAAGVSLSTVCFVVLVSLLIAVLGIAYGRKEAKLRKDTVQLLSKQIETLQLLIDPTRSSSMLTSRGETAERDKQ